MAWRLCAPAFRLAETGGEGVSLGSGASDRLAASQIRGRGGLDQVSSAHRVAESGGAEVSESAAAGAPTGWCRLRPKVFLLRRTRPGPSPSHPRRSAASVFVDVAAGRLLRTRVSAAIAT